MQYKLMPPADAVAYIPLQNCIDTCLSAIAYTLSEYSDMKLSLSNEPTASDTSNSTEQYKLPLQAHASLAYQISYIPLQSCMDTCLLALSYTPGEYSNMMLSIEPAANKPAAVASTSGSYPSTSYRCGRHHGESLWLRAGGQ